MLPPITSMGTPNTLMPRVRSLTVPHLDRIGFEYGRLVFIDAATPCCRNPAGKR